jgi:hypothetical protein
MTRLTLDWKPLRSREPPAAAMEFNHRSLILPWRQEISTTSSARNGILSKSITLASWTLFVIPFVVYSLRIIRYAANVPLQDDYDAALAFTNTFIRLPKSADQIALLFSQHNEHRIVLDHVVFLSNYYLLHEINFKLSVLIGNLGWILTTIMLVSYFHKEYHLSLAQLVPIPYLLLSFTHWENMFFAMASIQNYWFMFFSVAFIICLSKHKPLWFCALFPMALFTSGGGIVLYPLGNLFLVLQRRWRSFGWFFVLSSSCMLLYSYHYHKPPHHPSIPGAVLTPLKTTAHFFYFWGNIAPFEHIPLLIGIVLCSLSFYLVVRRHGSSFFQLTIGFIALIAIATTLTRSGFGSRQALSSRYSLFPLVGMACVYTCIIASLSKRIALSRVVLVCAILGATSFWGIVAFYFQHNGFFQEMQGERVASMVAFSNGDKGRLLYPDRERAARILHDAEQTHIYDCRVVERR